MGESDNTLFVEMTNRYAEPNLPWDIELPPPEVIELVSLNFGIREYIGNDNRPLFIQFALLFHRNHVDFPRSIVPSARMLDFSFSNKMFLKPPYAVAPTSRWERVGDARMQYRL
jgi:hypothetical protein